MNFYKRFVGDYQRDTGHLSLTEHGAYTLLLDIHYATEKPLPSSKQSVYRLLRAIDESEQTAIDRILDEFWTQTDNGWVNPKALELIDDKQKRSEKAKELADKRWENTEKASDSDASGDAKASDSDASGDAKASDSDASGDAKASDSDASGDAKASDSDASGDAKASNSESGPEKVSHSDASISSEKGAENAHKYAKASKNAYKTDAKASKNVTKPHASHSHSQRPDPKAKSRTPDPPEILSQDLRSVGPRNTQKPPRSHGSRLSPDWVLPDDWRTWALEQGLRNPDWEADQFRDYWLAKSGKDATKRDWRLTWQVWVRREVAHPRSLGGEGPIDQMKRLQREGKV